MIKNLVPLGGKLEERKWLIAGLAAFIAVAAAVISVLVYFSKREEMAENEAEEDCFAE